MKIELPPKMLRVIESAKEAGYNIVEYPDCVFIMRGKTTRSLSLIMWEDGKAYRGDVPHRVAKTITTEKEMREVLKLPSK